MPMTAALLAASDEGSVLFVLFVLGCIGAAFLGVAERWFGLPPTLHRWAIGWGVAIGVLVFAYRAWYLPARREDSLMEHFVAGLVYGLLSGLALTYVIPFVLFLYFFLLRPGG